MAVDTLPTLPIDEYQEKIKNLYLSSQNLLIPPLLQKLSGKKVYIIQPRRLAAKLAATRVGVK